MNSIVRHLLNCTHMLDCRTTRKTSPCFCTSAWTRYISSYINQVHILDEYLYTTSKKKNMDEERKNNRLNVCTHINSYPYINRTNYLLPQIIYIRVSSLELSGIVLQKKQFARPLSYFCEIQFNVLLT